MKKITKNTKCILIAIAIIVTQLTCNKLEAQNLKAWQQQQLPGFSDGPSETTKTILIVTGAVCLIIIGVLIVKKVNQNKTQTGDLGLFVPNNNDMFLMAALKNNEKLYNQFAKSNNTSFNTQTSSFGFNCNLGLSMNNSIFNSYEYISLKENISSSIYKSFVFNQNKNDFIFTFSKVKTNFNFNIANRN